MSNSWWVDVSDEQFAARAAREADRMMLSKAGQWRFSDAGECPLPPRHKPRTPYTYHLKKARVEG